MPTKKQPPKKVRSGPTAIGKTIDAVRAGHGLPPLPNQHGQAILGAPPMLKKGLAPVDIVATIKLDSPADFEKAKEHFLKALTGASVKPTENMLGFGLHIDDAGAKLLKAHAVAKGVDPHKVKLISHAVIEPKLTKSVVVVEGVGMKTLSWSFQLAMAKSQAEMAETMRTDLLKAFDEVMLLQKPLQKAADLVKEEPALVIPVEPDEDDEGMFTSTGIAALTAYANAWLADERDLELEREHPALTGPFYDIRSDPDYARRWADDVASLYKPSYFVPGHVFKSLEQVLADATFDEKHVKAHKASMAKGTVTGTVLTSGDQGDGTSIDAAGLETSLLKAGLTKKKPAGFQKATFVIDDKG